MPPSKNVRKRTDLPNENFRQPLFVKDYLENAAFFLLLGIIVLSAIPFGTVDVWSKSLFVFLICLVGVIRVIGIFFNGSLLFNNGSLIFPLAGILGLAIIQITPSFFGDQSVISADPESTKNFILFFSGLIVAIETLLAYATTEKRLKALIALILIVGLGSAVFGVFRMMFLTEGDTGLSSYFKAGAGFAQFINRNHFLYLMEMTIGLLLGFLIKGNLTEKYKFGVWLSLGFLILISISANSRGGLISLTAIFLTAAVVHLTLRHKNRSGEKSNKKTAILRQIGLVTIFTCLFFGVIIVTIAFVGGDTVVTRIETIQTEVEQPAEQKINRLAIWNSTLELIKEKPISGAGFGAYHAAITKYDTANGNMSLQQAHNDYLEILANGGIIAFLLFLMFVYVFIKQTFEQYKSRDYLRRSACFGALLGIIGVAIHSFVDFGLHALSNSLIFIVLIVIATAKISDSEKSLKSAA